MEKTLKCVSCGEDAGNQHWIKKDGIICNDCETEIYRTYCEECEVFFENINPCTHQIKN